MRSRIPLLALSFLVLVPGRAGVGNVQAHRQFQHGFPAHGRAFLRQIADARGFEQRDGARVAGFLAEDDGEERGFPGTVGADEAEAVAAVHRQRHVGEQRPRAVRFGESGNGQHAARILANNAAGASGNACRSRTTFNPSRARLT